jgi:hypothetical protein
VDKPGEQGLGVAPIDPMAQAIVKIIGIRTGLTGLRSTPTYEATLSGGRWMPGFT